MVGGSLQGKKTNTFLNLALRVPLKDRKAILELWGLFHQANKLVQLVLSSFSRWETGSEE